MNTKFNDDSGITAGGHIDIESGSDAGSGTDTSLESGSDAGLDPASNIETGNSTQKRIIMNSQDLDHIALQPIRVGAIRLQIESLTKQALVIQKIATEHHQGLNLGLDPELRNILSATGTLSEQIDQIVQAADANDNATVCSVGGKILHQTNLLTGLAADFKRGESAKARAHLAEAFEPCKPEETVATSDEQTSSIKASLNCFKAEINQYSTLELQVQALCHLALEVAFNAADQVKAQLAE
jgi:hypothetical protein